MGIRPITRWYDIFGKFLDESSEIPSMPPFPLPPSEPAFVNPSTTKAPDFEKIKKSRASYNKNWKPDWSLEREVVRIESDDENYETFDEIEVFEEENGFFRLYETPVFSENLQWGDLIQAERSEEGVLCFLSFVERPDYDHKTSILSSKVTGTGENSFVEKNQKYLKELMDAGGFWQLDMGGMLTTITPPGFDLNGSPIAAEDKDDVAAPLTKAQEPVPTKTPRNKLQKKITTEDLVPGLLMAYEAGIKLNRVEMRILERSGKLNQQDK